MLNAVGFLSWKKIVAKYEYDHTRNDVCKFLLLTVQNTCMSREVYLKKKKKKKEEEEKDTNKTLKTSSD